MQHSVYIEDITRWREDMNFIFERQNNISEDVRRFPKIAKDFQGRPEDVSMINQWI